MLKLRRQMQRRCAWRVVSNVVHATNYWVAITVAVKFVDTRTARNQPRYARRHAMPARKPQRCGVAVALLVAIFRARPSPFYVMDEVEAALDETNLGRLISILEELREASQLIVITHQKRTMEIADALYGVTMREDGISTVISQRLREVESVA